jgi:hypothetical protein
MIAGLIPGAPASIEPNRIDTPPVIGLALPAQPAAAGVIVMYGFVIDFPP